jgi:hypothetical protein
MLHLVDGFVFLFIGQTLEAHVFQHLGVQKVLVDGRKLILEHPVEKRDDVFVKGLHGDFRVERAGKNANSRLKIQV